MVKFDTMDEPCRRHMLAQLLVKADICPSDMDYVVGRTDDYTGAQLEELANTLYILAVAGHNNGSRVPAGVILIGRESIDSAMGNVQFEPTQRMGFQVTQGGGNT